MYGTNVVTSGLTLGKVLTGISKGLTIANQVIPLYQQAKPMINNARKVMSVLKEMNTSPSISNENKKTGSIINTIDANSIEKTSSSIGSSQSMPVFFQ